MQDAAHVIVKGQKVLVLRRVNLAANYVSLKVRKTGQAGMYLPDESAHLEQNPDALEKLLNGKVIKL